MAYEITIMSAVDELQRAFRGLNEHYFNNELEKPIITIQTDVTSGAYAWITTGKVWSQKDHSLYREINITAEYLDRPAELVIASLLHEMCHLKNLQDGIQDTSRNGTYHNKEFKKTAEEYGLIVTKTEKYGYCHTTPSDELKEWVSANVRRGCFRYARAKTYKDGSPKTTTGTGKNGKETTTSRTKQSSIKYICPTCGITVRSTRNLDDKLICADCQTWLIRA